MGSVYAWPDDLPSECPPVSASEADGPYLRLVKHNPPQDEDFRRPRDLPRREPFTNEELCAASALSLFGDYADIVLARKYIPGFKGRLVAQRTLVPGVGLILRTPIVLAISPEGIALESHTDWWVPIGVDPVEGFKVKSDE